MLAQPAPTFPSFHRTTSTQHRFVAATGNSSIGADETADQTDPDLIAIIGIGCRFPGRANDPQSYWELLRSGTDAISETPSDRWSLQKFYAPGATMPGKTQSKWGGYVEGIDQFDPQLFGISPREAASMDPQQRMLLEVTWRAFEDAGCPVEKVAGQPVSVFAGISSFDYAVAGLSSQDRGCDFPVQQYGRIQQHRRESNFVLLRPARTERRRRYGLLVIVGRRSHGLRKSAQR